jgi:hypothetical protein
LELMRIRAREFVSRPLAEIRPPQPLFLTRRSGKLGRWDRVASPIVSG